MERVDYGFTAGNAGVAKTWFRLRSYIDRDYSFSELKDSGSLIIPNKNNKNCRISEGGQSFSIISERFEHSRRHRCENFKVPTSSTDRDYNSKYKGENTDES